MLPGVEILYSYSLDWICRWSSATGSAFGLEVHNGIWLKYRIFGLVRFVPAPWLPFWFTTDNSALKIPWELPFVFRHTINLPVIRFGCLVDDELARISAYAGFLHHVIILGDSYKGIFKVIQKFARNANRRTKCCLLPARFYSNLRMSAFQRFFCESIAGRTPCPPLHYIQNLLHADWRHYVSLEKIRGL